MEPASQAAFDGHKAARSGEIPKGNEPSDRTEESELKAESALKNEGFLKKDIDIGRCLKESVLPPTTTMPQNQRNALLSAGRLSVD